jgi:hypothetical protein
MKKRLNEVDIKITKVVITRISIELEEGKDEPTYNVTGKLLTEQGMNVSEVHFTNQSWYDESKKIKIPWAANIHSAEIFQAFIPVVSEKINGIFKALPAPKKKDDNVPF